MSFKLSNDVVSINSLQNIANLGDFLDTINEGFVEIDNNCVIKSVNHCFKKTSGFDVLDSTQLFFYFDEDQQELIKQNLQVVKLQGKSCYEITFKTSSTQTTHCLFKHVLLQNNEKTAIGSFIIVSDITEQKQVEIALRASNAELEQIVSTQKQVLTETLEKISIADEKIKHHDEEITTQNDMLKFQNEMLSEQINELTAAEEEVVSQRDLLQFQNEMLSEQIHELTAAEEEIRTQRDSLQQQTEDLQEALLQVKLSQAKLVESEKMVALGQLIAGVAHEINTPLGAIRSSVGNISNVLTPLLFSLPSFFEQLNEVEKKIFFDLLTISIQRKITITSKEERAYRRKQVQILEEHAIARSDYFASTLVDMGVYENIEEYLPCLLDNDSKNLLLTVYKLSGILRSSQTITLATERASKVVFALKNFAHFNHSGEMVKANIIDTVETVLTLYHNQLKHGISLIKNFENVPAIMCYPDELNQVWTNLIHNALQAMDYVGNLQIDISQDQLHIYVSITDSGKGIPVEIQDKIFNVFFTTKPQGEGSGLGLDIVKRIVEKHLGAVTFVSLPGATTFTVKLTKTITEIK